MAPKERQPTVADDAIPPFEDGPDATQDDDATEAPAPAEAADETEQ